MGSTELIIILIIVTLIFGGAAIPKLAKSVGIAKKEFDNALAEDVKPKKV